MFLKSSRVSFHNKQTPVYFGGDTVAGTISFDLAKEKTLADLTFEALGDTKCKWSVRTNKSSTNYHGFELIFNTKYSLLNGYERENGNVTLQPGTHTFNFMFSLPPNAPTVITGVYGRVKYTMQITAVRKMRFNVPLKVPFFVISINDLNTNPLYARPMTLQLSKTFSTFFVNQGSMSVDVTLPFVGYVSGQSIQMQCNIKNPSKVKISAVIFSLKQFNTFVCTVPQEASKELKQTIVKFIGSGAERGQEVSYPASIEIPSLPPSTVHQCLITTKYFLKVKAIVDGLHKNPKAVIAITIGTVPLYTPQNYVQHRLVDFSIPSTSTAQPLPFYNPLQPSAPPGNITPDGPPPYNELYPPTYMECRTSNNMMETHSDDEDAVVAHAPVYRSYKFRLWFFGFSIFFIYLLLFFLFIYFYWIHEIRLG